MASEFFGRQREFCFYTAGCGNQMAVSVTGPRAVNELGGPVIPGRVFNVYIYLYAVQLTSSAPLALQGALHHKLAGDVNGVRVSGRCDKHPNGKT